MRDLTPVLRRPVEPATPSEHWPKRRYQKNKFNHLVSLRNDSRRSIRLAAELLWSEGTRDGLTTDLVDLLESVSSGMRVFGNCCSHYSPISSGTTPSDCRQEIKEIKHE
jgi:hypothetical protein